MAVARQDQSSTMLYTAIVFVGLFIIAAVVAVVFFIKAQDFRDQLTQSQQQLSEIANSSEVSSIGTIVGQKAGQDSRVRQLISYIDNLYRMDTGIAPQETSAEAKVLDLQSKYNGILGKLPKEFAIKTEPNDVNAPGLFRIVDIYDNKLSQKNTTIDELNGQIAKINNDFDSAKKGSANREQELLSQLNIVRQDANSVQQSYNQLRDLMEKKSDEQTKALLQQRDEAINEKNKTKQEQLETLNNLSITQTRLQDALGKLEVLKPKPKEDVAAYHPDGHIITVDIQSNVVFIDIGSDSKVYPGLTFAVYDRSAPIPTDGTSKGEIEVFDVSQNTATARIINSSKRNPVAEGDIIVNLIWDSKAVNTFVIAGDFDFNGDGHIDTDAKTKIAQLVENWGGKIEENVTIDTDYVILGSQPEQKKKPTLDEIEADPLANQKYEDSAKAIEKYNEVKTQAKDLYIPVFNLKRFLNFTGYESLAAKSNN
jgi:predicted  nucleic acid-binding Zn-ribbon protein